MRLPLSWHWMFLLMVASVTIQLWAQEQPPASTKQQPASLSQQPAKTKQPEGRPQAHKRKIPDLSGFEMADVTKIKADRTVLGATRGLQSQLVLLAPRLGKFYGEDALFAWKYDGRGQSFSLVFRDDNDTEVLRKLVNGVEYRNTNMPAFFQAGKTYTWSVETYLRGASIGGAGESEFVVVSPAEREQIETTLAAIGSASDYSTQLRRARVFRDHRLWYDAVGAYTELISRFPDRSKPYEERGGIYAQLPVTHDFAIKDFERVDQLRRGGH